MKRLASLVTLCVLIGTAQAGAQQPISKRADPMSRFPDRALTLFGGAVDYYSGSAWAYPMVAVSYAQAVVRPLTLGVEVAHVAAKASVFCLLSQTCSDQADPLWYLTLDLQIHPVVGRLRPYVGASAGVLTNCEKGWCRSLGLEGGLRVPVTHQGGVQLEGRWRADQRYAFESSHSKELRLGVFVAAL
jgi:hypothetical protein